MSALILKSARIGRVKITLPRAIVHWIFLKQCLVTF